MAKSISHCRGGELPPSSRACHALSEIQMRSPSAKMSLRRRRSFHALPVETPNRTHRARSQIAPLPSNRSSSVPLVWEVEQRHQDERPFDHSEPGPSRPRKRRRLGEEENPPRFGDVASVTNTQMSSSGATPPASQLTISTGSGGATPTASQLTSRDAASRGPSSPTDGESPRAPSITDVDAATSTPIMVEDTTPDPRPATTPAPAPPPPHDPFSAYACPICFCPPINATLTPCGHICCGSCLFTAIKTTTQRALAMMADPSPRCARCCCCCC